MALALWLMPVFAAAQSAQIARLLENQLSNEERKVEITGFEGALTARATIDRIRVSDAQGVWLEARGLLLDWNRAALLAGRLDVRALTAEQISLLRAPQSAGPQLPSEEASGFRIPDLPVAVALDRLEIGRLRLGESLLGVPLEARLALSARLDGAALALALEAERIDGQPGRAELDFSYADESHTLTVRVDVSEPRGGVVARALSLPGLPSVALSVAGAGPLDDFVAQVALDTDGAERLAGQVTLAGREAGPRAFEAALAGDIRALLPETERAFFGPETRLIARGQRAADGAIDLERLEVSADAFMLTSQAALDASGAPLRLDLEAALTQGTRLRLPGTDITLARADMTFGFDASVSDEWLFDLEARDVENGQVAIASLGVDAQGRLRSARSARGAPPLSGAFIASARGVEIADDAALSEALGADITLASEFDLDEENTLTLANIAGFARHVSLTGAARLAPAGGRAAMDGAISLSAPDLSPFSNLAGLPLEGAIAADLSFEAELPGGAARVALRGQTRALDLGVAQLAPILSPESSLNVALARDTGGTRIERFELVNPELTASLSGALNASDGAVELSARLREIGVFNDLVAGPLDLNLTVSDLQGSRTLKGAFETSFGLLAVVSGALSGPLPGLNLRASLDDTQRFVPQLSGVTALAADIDLASDGAESAPEISALLSASPGVEMRVSGPLAGPDQAFDVVATVAEMSNFVPILAGPAELKAKVSELSESPLLAAELSAEPGLTVALKARPLDGERSIAEIEASARDLGFLVPQLSGAATAELTLRDLLGAQEIDARLRSARGVTLTA
ncbi:MAG: hypothetical protein AAF647_07660, partial [Pseudomonadota bacterium]